MAITEALRLLVTADTQGAVQGIEKLGATSERELGRSTKTIDKWGHGLTKAGAGMIAFGGVAVAGLLSAGQAASDLNEVASKSATVFGEANKKVDEFASSAADIGLSKKAALEAASGFGNMFDQLGIASDKAADMSIEITKLAADFASFHNADITEVLEAQSAAFRGEYDSIQKFLPLLSAATVEQRAMEVSGKDSTDALTAQDKALAVHKLMLEGAGQAQGDFSRTSDSAANQQRILAAEFENMKASLGQGVLPVMKTALGIANDLVGGFSDLNAVSSGLLGQIASVGAVAVIAAGGLSILAGQVIKARQNLDFLSGTASLLGRSAGPLGILVGSVVALDAAFDKLFPVKDTNLTKLENDLVRFTDSGRLGAEAARLLGKDFEELKKATAEVFDAGAMDDLSHAAEEIMSGGGLIQGDKRDLEKAKQLFDDIDKTLASIAAQSPDQAAAIFERITEEMKDAGATGEDVKGVFDDYADVLAKADTTSRLTEESTADLGEELDKQAVDAEKAKEALDALNEELDALLSQYLSVDQAIAKQNEGFLGVDAHLKEMREEYGRNALALDVTTAAGIKNTEMLDGLVESAAGVIEKMREEGATEEDIQAQWASSRGQLQLVIDKFRAAGVDVSKYDEILRGVDSHVVTTVEARGLAATMGQLGELKRKYDGAEYLVRVQVAASQRGGINVGGGVRVFHEGGVVPGPRGREVAAVLQAGEEVLALNDPRNTANARHVAPAFAGMGSAGGGTARVVIDVTGGDDQFVRWLRGRVKDEGGNVQVVLGRGAA